ncbi:hypothetical protein SD81_038565 [Tolypothrix campylonemoides VB511288]|nr:hypothetical protein SD81_038565 [Tolypothrix campylonemoides VB511288]
MRYLPLDEAAHATSQFVAVRHSDRNHEHLHIIASRIRLDGSLVNDSYDYFNSQVSTRRIAAQLGLEVTPTTNEAVAFKLEQEYGITASTSPNRSPSIRAVNSKHKTPTSKEIIRSAIGEAIKDSPTISTFIQRLEENNIAVLPKMRGDELLGFTYIHNHVKIAGYQVYKHYSWKKLQSEYKLIYKPSRDIDVLQQAKTKAFSRINNTNVSKEEYSTNDKPTSSSTSNSSGDTDRNSNLPISTNLLTSNYSDEGLIVEPKLEDKVTAATGGTKRKVQFSQQEQRSRQSLPPQEESEIEQSSQAQLKEQHSQDSPPEETFLPTTEQLPSKQSASEETLLPSHLCHLPSTITDYMLVTNRLRINGRELSASLDENVLSVCRHGDNTPVMQTQYSEGKWYEVQPTRLTANEIEQIESLRTFTQQALINKSQSKGGIEQ